MKISFCISFFWLLAFSGYTQTFAAKHGKRNKTCTVAQKYTDSIRINTFSLEPDYTKLESSILLLRRTSEVPRYSSKNMRAVQLTENDLIVNYSDTLSDHKKNKLQLYRADPNLDNALKKDCYYSQKYKQLEVLEDSLSCSANNQSILLLFNEDHVDYDSIPYFEYVRVVDFISDSLIKSFAAQSNKMTLPYYTAIQNIKELESDLATQLLDSADFNYSYSNRFLETLAYHQPQLLIQYIDQKKTNEKNVLKAIRKHDKYKEIITHVKASGTTESYGKQMILKQEKTRKTKLIAKRSFQVATVLAQATLTVGVLLWIF